MDQTEHSPLSELSPLASMCREYCGPKTPCLYANAQRPS